MAKTDTRFAARIADSPASLSGKALAEWLRLADVLPAVRAPCDAFARSSAPHLYAFFTAYAHLYAPFF